MRILLVKTSALGDIVHCFQVARYIKQCLPDAFLGWVVEKPFSELVKAHPDVDRVYLIESKRWRKHLYKRSIWKEMSAFRRELREQPYDLVIDLQGNIKSGIVTSLVDSKRKVGFATPYAAERPNTWATNERYLPPPGRNIREDYLFLAQQAIYGPPFETMELASVNLKASPEQLAANKQFLDGLPEQFDKKIMVFPGAAWKNKQLSEEDLASFLQRFEATYGMGVLLAWGSPDERAIAERLQSQLKNAVVMDRLALPQLQNLIASMDLVIAMDSLPLHLTGSAQVPTYSFFGPSSASKYAPKGLKSGFYQGACPYNVTFASRCPQLRTCETGLCLRRIDVDPTFDAFKVWWDSYNNQKMPSTNAV